VFMSYLCNPRPREAILRQLADYGRLIILD